MLFSLQEWGIVIRVLVAKPDENHQRTRKRPRELTDKHCNIAETVCNDLRRPSQNCILFRSWTKLAQHQFCLEQRRLEEIGKDKSWRQSKAAWQLSKSLFFFLLLAFFARYLNFTHLHSCHLQCSGNHVLIWEPRAVSNIDRIRSAKGWRRSCKDGPQQSWHDNKNSTGNALPFCLWCLFANKKGLSDLLGLAIISTAWDNDIQGLSKICLTVWACLSRLGQRTDRNSPVHVTTLPGPEAAIDDNGLV